MEILRNWHVLHFSKTDSVCCQVNDRLMVLHSLGGSRPNGVDLVMVLDHMACYARQPLQHGLPKPNELGQHQNGIYPF